MQWNEWGTEAFAQAAREDKPVLLDIGAQMTQIANQTRIFGLVASARSRLNTVYMVLYFVGAAMGSWLSTLAWAHWGWNGVCLLALGFMALAALRHITGIRTVISAQPHDPTATTPYLEA